MTPDRRLERLRSAHGEFGLHEETVDVDRETYEAFAGDADRDALGGARVVLRRGDRARLFVDVRDDPPGWDVPGGGREPGESLAETARREVREEVGLAVALGTVVHANRFSFAHGDDSVDVQPGELHGAAGSVNCPRTSIPSSNRWPTTGTAGKPEVSDESGSGRRRLAGRRTGPGRHLDRRGGRRLTGPQSGPRHELVSAPLT